MPSEYTASALVCQKVEKDVRAALEKLPSYDERLNLIDFLDDLYLELKDDILNEPQPRHRPSVLFAR